MLDIFKMVAITIADKSLDRPALQGLLIEFYELQRNRLPPEVKQKITIEEVTQDFWNDLDEYFAPNGCIALAHDDDGALIGCGMMRKVRPDAAEFKRMYVRPAGRGHGIGRKLIAARMAEARKLGLTPILADTLKASTTMHGIYRDLGFQQIEKYPESHTADHFPVVADQLIYFQMDL